MKLFHLNVRGLCTNVAHIFDILSTHRNIDIFAVSETHISDEPGELFDIGGYKFVHKNRTNGKGWGISFYINERPDWRRRDDLECDDLECIRIEVFIKGSKNELLCVMYRPPESLVYQPINFKTLLHMQLKTASNKVK